MTRPTSLGQTSPSTAELGPFLSSAADNPQSRADAVLSTAPPANITTQALAGDSNFQKANIQKTAIVTGGSQGIGAGLVKAFLDRGYNVVANSRNITKANPFPPSANLALADGDIGDPKKAAKIVDTVVSRFGRIDVLINNAGVFIP